MLKNMSLDVDPFKYAIMQCTKQCKKKREYSLRSEASPKHAVAHPRTHYIITNDRSLQPRSPIPSLFAKNKPPDPSSIQEQIYENHRPR